MAINRKIMIVDDDVDFLNAIRRNFHKKFDIIFASSAMDALNKLRNDGSVAVVVSDFKMPEVDGVQFLEKVKDEYPDTVRILFTGFVDVEVAMNAVNKGNIFRLLSKPLPIADLANAIKDALDLYELINLEKDLNKIKSGFVSQVSHEYKNPLTKISLSVELLKMYYQKDLDEKFTTYTSAIEESVKEMNNLLNDLLTLGKVAQKEKNNGEHSDIVYLLSYVIDELSYVDRGKHNVRVSVEFDNLITTHDASLFKHIFNNLISNAMKYSPNSKEVRVCLKNTKDSVSLEVEDHGIGIPQKNLSKLFVPFYRCDNTGNIEGTGLGLAIVQNCVEQLQSKVQVVKSDESGTIFRVDFPKSLFSALNIRQ
jgi:signal transduction histidine kinase